MGLSKLALSVAFAVRGLNSLMVRVVIARAHYYQILRSVVVSPTVYMVNEFAFSKGSSKYICHNHPMLSYPTFLISHWTARFVNFNIPRMFSGFIFNSGCFRYFAPAKLCAALWRTGRRLRVLSQKLFAATYARKTDVSLPLNSQYFPMPRTSHKLPFTSSWLFHSSPFNINLAGGIRYVQ